MTTPWTPGRFGWATLRSGYFDGGLYDVTEEARTDV